MRLLDLYCGAGGAAAGYMAAGFVVVGVDIADQPNYSGDEFHQDDAREVLKRVRPGDFDLIHASPPCQHFTKYRNVVKNITDRYQNHLAETVHMLADVHASTGIPSIVENVPGAPMNADLILCGSQFGLNVRRHRWFELIGWSAMGPGGCNHKSWTRQFKSSTDRPNLRYTMEIGSWDEKLEDQKKAMGVDWPITVRELSEAIPPAYTKFIGEAFIEQLVRSE